MVYPLIVSHRLSLVATAYILLSGKIDGNVEMVLPLVMLFGIKGKETRVS